MKIKGKKFMNLLLKFMREFTNFSKNPYAQDLVEMRKVNKTFYEFLNNEEDFLWKKFEKATVKIRQPNFCHCTYRHFQKYYIPKLQEQYKVSVWFDSKDPRLCQFFTITGDLQGVCDAVQNIISVQ